MKEKNHPKHKFALAAVNITGNRQVEIVLKNKEAASAELPTRTAKNLTHVKTATEA